MALSIGRVDTAAEREAIYAFRYRVYVEEAAMTAEADHDRRMLHDEYDEAAVSYAVHEDGEVVGSLRVILLEDVPERAPLVAKFGLGPLLDVTPQRGEDDLLTVGQGHERRAVSPV